MNIKLAETAEKQALAGYHGNTSGENENIDEIIEPFPKMDFSCWDGRWCAAFVYYCCNKAGINFSPRPKECVSCTLAGCKAWEELALSDKRIEYCLPEPDYKPEPGDIVLFDNIFENHEHDHIGIVLKNEGNYIITAEGNVDNRSAVMKRPKDEHIRAYIKLQEDYYY